MTGNNPTLDSNLAPGDRQASLMAWLAERGLSLAALGRLIGVTAQGAHQMLRSQTVHPWRRQQLLGVGIPDELLPPAEIRNAGRRAPRAPQLSGPSGEDCGERVR